VRALEGLIKRTARDCLRSSDLGPSLGGAITILAALLAGVSGFGLGGPLPHKRDPLVWFDTLTPRGVLDF
jgi:hypothetical protein